MSSQYYSTWSGTTLLMIDPNWSVLELLQWNELEQIEVVISCHLHHVVLSRQRHFMPRDESI